MQQVLSANTFHGISAEDLSTLTRNGSTYCFTNIWNDREARFEPCFLPVVGSIPAAIAAVVLFLQAVVLLVTWRPQWTRPFVQEFKAVSLDDDLIPRRPKSPFVPALVILSVAGFFLQLIVTAGKWTDAGRVAPVVAWFAIAGILFIQRPRTAPVSILAILVPQAIVQIILLSDGHWFRNGQQKNFGIAALIMAATSIILVLLMPLRDPALPAKEVSVPFSEPSSSLRSPEDNLTLWQFLSVVWMTPLIAVGYKRQLQEDDVWSLAYEFQHERLHEHFRVLKGTVMRRLIKANAIDLCILGTMGVIQCFLMYSPPVLLEYLLASMEDPSAPKRAAVSYAAITVAIRLVACQSEQLSLWYGRRCYERSRGEMITMLYEKTLGRRIAFAPEAKEKDGSNGDTNGQITNGTAAKAKSKSIWGRAWSTTTSCFSRQKAAPPTQEPASMGKILNLMRNDVYEVAQRFWEFQDLIRKPLSVVFSITLVVSLLGWPSMIAVLTLFVAQILVLILARIRVYYEKKRRLATDHRLQVVSQFVEAIRHLRWYGWQGAWLEQIFSARQKELNLRITTAVWNIAIGFINTAALDLSPVIAFFAYTVIAGRPLRVEIAFPAMQLFHMMINSLRDLPDLITVLINAYVAVDRIESFMAEPDRQDSGTEALIGETLALESASFAWPGKAEPVLRDISLSFPPGLTVIFGEVASGKTALLQALLGELDQLDGQLIRPHEPIAYCSQTPWLQSMSIKENILFSAPYDEKRYKAVLDACALTPDLAEFRAGDLSLIGENGVGLSGGQKARLALARAVYSTTNILLLDDPLSSLDQQTAELIVRRCFNGELLKGRTIVLVTHRIDLVLHIADQFVEVENGQASIAERSAVPPRTFRRTQSSESTREANDKPQENKDQTAAPEKFIEDEYRAHGGVRASVYWNFIKAGKIRWWLSLILVLTVYRLASVAEAWFLKTWGEAYNRKSTLIFSLTDPGVIDTTSGPLDGLPSPDVNVKPWLWIFFGLALYQSISFVMFRTVLIVILYTTAKSMFADIMESVAGATFRFYDVTPVGRLMNRMTSDIGVIDGNISMQLQAVVWLLISWITSAVVVGSVTPTFLIFVVLLVILFVMIFMRFIPTSQSLRRLEMVSLTPLMSNFGALLQGLATVRAFRAQSRFQNRVFEVVDTFQKMDHFYWSLQAWLLYRYQILMSLATFVVTLLALATNVSAGLTAFVLLSANKLVDNTQALCKQYGQLQMEFVAVERVVELIDLNQEPKGEVSPPAWWPSFSGDLVFNDVTIKYAPHLDPALAGISFTVKGGSKTAIIGRTGSGKSTLALSILATVVPEAGKIVLDNIDLAEVDKQLLRTRVTFLAQDPVLFPGSMRENLDPVKEHTDEACFQVLHRVCERQGWNLDTKVEAGGRNLSQGQRQLVGLARAVLRKSAIVILDEATASIDRDTAMQIQQIMHEEMKESTVITIAHRLEAVKNADYCIVLGKGQILREGPADSMLGSLEAESPEDERASD